MKQLLLFLVISLSVLSISAQEFKWDINAGYLHATARLKGEYADFNIYS